MIIQFSFFAHIHCQFQVILFENCVHTHIYGIVTHRGLKFWWAGYGKSCWDFGSAVSKDGAWPELVSVLLEMWNLMRNLHVK